MQVYIIFVRYLFTMLLYFIFFIIFFLRCLLNTHLCIILELLIAKFLTYNAAFPVPVYLSKENENPG